MEPTLAYVFDLQLVDQLRHEVADRSDIAAGQRAGDGLLRRHRRLDRAVGGGRGGARSAAWPTGSASLATDLLRPPVRVVKMIGDAAMFVSPDEGPLLDLALDLVDAAEADDELPAAARRPRVRAWRSGAGATGTGGR